MTALEQTIAHVRAATTGVDPEACGAWHFSPAKPGTYGYHGILIADGRKVASVLEKWPAGAGEFIAAASPVNVGALLAEIDRLRDRVNGLLGAMNREVERRRDMARELDTLRTAALALYMAGRWDLSPNGPGMRLSSQVQAHLWEQLRDALKLETGTATAAGIGADPDEPPLPFDPEL